MKLFYFTGQPGIGQVTRFFVIFDGVPCWHNPRSTNAMMCDLREGSRNALTLANCVEVTSNYITEFGDQFNDVPEDPFTLFSAVEPVRKFFQNVKTLTFVRD